MTCREFDRFLADYLDRGLPRTTQIAMRWHFLLCTKCRAYLREYRRAIELGKAAVRDSDEPLPDEVPRELVEKVMARIDKKH